MAAKTRLTNEEYLWNHRFEEIDMAYKYKIFVVVT